MGSKPLKRVHWIGSSKKDLKKLPDQVQDDVGYALHMAQEGLKHPDAKVLKGFGSAGVLEVVSNDSAGTYRGVYTVQFADTVYVLHCFQKKSTQGIATSKHDLDLIRSRLAEATQLANREAR
jgi:phage-related protein